MRVLMVTPAVDEQDPVLGFIPTWINSLAKRVDKLNVVTLGYNEETRLPENVTVYSLGKKSGKLSKLLYFNSIMLRIIPRVDIIFCHMFPDFILISAPYAKLFRKLIITWYAHGHVSQKVKITHFLSDKMVTSSKEGLRIKSNKIVVIGQGIDTNKFKPAIKQKRKGDKKTIVSVGRISPIKDYDTFIRAANILVNEKGMKNLEFLIVGGVPMASQEVYYEKLKKMVEELGLKDHLKFVGPVPHSEVVSYYQDCDVFVSTSQTGSIDKTTLEAMACQKPALACNEAFENVFGDYSSILMFRKEDPADLARKVTHILQMEENRRNELCCNMSEIVKREHSVENFTDKLVRIFNNVVRR